MSCGCLVGVLWCGLHDSSRAFFERCRFVIFLLRWQLVVFFILFFCFFAFEMKKETSGHLVRGPTCVSDVHFRRSTVVFVECCLCQVFGQGWMEANEKKIAANSKCCCGARDVVFASGEFFPTADSWLLTPSAETGGSRLV